MSTPTTDRQITVIVFAPRHPDSKRFTWPPSKKVGDAASEAAAAFGYQAGKPTLQKEDGTVLRPEQTLHDAGVREGDKLELVDTGGGVAAQ